MSDYSGNQLHCKCLQGFTGSLRGNWSAGISNLWGLHVPTIPVIWKSPYSDFHCNICREFDFTGILWGYPTLDIRKSCINYRKTM